MHKILLVALAPVLETRSPALPTRAGNVSKRLAALCSVQERELSTIFDLAYLFNVLPGSKDKFPIREARAAAESFHIEGRRAILIGRAVAWAFGLRQLKPFVWTFHRNAAIAYIPQPSRENLLYDDPQHWEYAKDFMMAQVEASRKLWKAAQRE